jgi:hypothetical protein
VVIGPEVLAGAASISSAVTRTRLPPLRTHVAHPEFVPDLAYVNNLALVRERRIACDHKKNSAT